jgi:hypothetical protein
MIITGVDGRRNKPSIFFIIIIASKYYVFSKITMICVVIGELLERLAAAFAHPHIILSIPVCH